MFFMFHVSSSVFIVYRYTDGLFALLDRFNFEAFELQTCCAMVTVAHQEASFPSNAIN